MAFHLRVMTSSDIPAGMRLKEIAGWNQTAGDWKRFLAASPEGCFVAEAGDRVLGTVATIAYERRFAWIGMVLVDPSSRGQGMGTKLLAKAIDYLDRCGIPGAKLDATPQGKILYEKLGFVSEYEIERWQLQRLPAVPASPERSGLTGEVLETDREVFGADRSALLLSIAAECPELVLQTRKLGKLGGYCLGRRGALADQLGPWVAENESPAADLLNGFLLRSTAARIFVNALKANAWAVKLLRQRGFEHSRPLTRMFRGRNDFPGRAELQGAILGPEFG